MEIVKLAGSLGAAIHGVQLADVSSADFSVIERALLDHQVLFFADQQLTPAEQVRFAERLGEPQVHPAYPTIADAPGLNVLEHTPDAPSKIDTWHSDMTFERRPPLGSVLCCRVAPPTGGDTLWASMYAAYDALSPAMRAFVDGLTAIHDFRHGFRHSLAEPGGYERLREAIVARPPVHHPAVRTHPVTGRKALFVNALFTTGIVGLTELESDAVLRMLCEHAVQPDFTVRFAWRPGSVAIWDNRCTQHRPINDYSEHRVMHRVTIAGDVPV